MRKSLNRSKQDIYACQRDSSRPVDLHSAERDLQNEVQLSRERNYQTRGLADAKGHFDRLFDKSVLEPLRDAAEATLDPVERPLLHRAAEITYELHQSSPLRRLAEVVGTRADERAADPLSRDEREKRRQSTTQLADIFRKLRQKRWT